MNLPQLTPIVGMHRSGTSATAGCLQRMGFDFGPAELLMPPSPANPRGYFESLEVVAIHDRLLRSLGCAWDSPQMRGDWLLTPAALAAEDAVTGWLNRLHGDGPFAVKDPRICLFPEVWEKALRRAKRSFDVQPLIVIRGAHAVAMSLARRDGIGHDHALELLHYYGLGVWRWAELFSVHAVLHFEHLHENPVAALRDTVTPWRCFLPLPDWEERVSDFIDEELVHG